MLCNPGFLKIDWEKNLKWPYDTEMLGSWISISVYFLRNFIACRFSTQVNFSITTASIYTGFK